MPFSSLSVLVMVIQWISIALVGLGYVFVQRRVISRVWQYTAVVLICRVDTYFRSLPGSRHQCFEAHVCYLAEFLVLPESLSVVPEQCFAPSDLSCFQISKGFDVQ
jgi:hypothetical protein